MFSRVMELIHSPPDLITSFDLSVMDMKPSVSIVATSPGCEPPVLIHATGGIRSISSAGKPNGPAPSGYRRPHRPMAGLVLLRRQSSSRRHKIPRPLAQPALRDLCFGTQPLLHSPSACCRCRAGLISDMPQAWSTRTP